MYIIMCVCVLCIMYIMYYLLRKREGTKRIKPTSFTTSFSQKAAFHRMNIRIYECLEFSNLAPNFHEI